MVTWARFPVPLFALQLQVCCSRHAVAGVTRRHHQVHHCLHLWNLFGFNELHYAQLTLLTRKGPSSMITGCTSSVLLSLYLFQLLSAPLGLSNHSLDSIYTHAWGRLGEALARSTHSPLYRTSLGGRGSRTSWGFVQHKTRNAKRKTGA